MNARTSQAMRPNLEFPLTVFYDASCPMCASEMHALQRLDRAGRLQLVDCSAPGFDERPYRREQITRTALMTRIHAHDARGRWLVGLDAFEAVYYAAGLTTVARFWGNARWRPILDPLYTRVARHRQLLSRLGLNRLVRWLLGTPGGEPATCAGNACRSKEPRG
jgi:predicted DCC family thiol-disulfide oxidoreductase YuxK